MDLTVDDGDIAQVYGRSGIGKSQVRRYISRCVICAHAYNLFDQLLRALANLRPLSSGRALLNGKTCHELGVRL